MAREVKNVTRPVTTATIGPRYEFRLLMPFNCLIES